MKLRPGVRALVVASVICGCGSSGAGPVSPDADAGGADAIGGGVPLTGVAAVSVGLEYACARTLDGEALCWGWNLNLYGRIGSDVERTALALPVQGLSGVSWISAGYTFTCVVTAGGVFKCFGDNQVGMLGNGRLPISSTTPMAINGLNIADGRVAAAQLFGCAWAKGGNGVICWGSGPIETVAHATSGVAPAVELFHDPSDPVQDVSAGAGHICVLRESGKVQTWGFNNGGLSVGTADAGGVTVPGLADVVDVSAGTSHSCAVLRGGTIRCWGLNSWGQLGDGTSNTSVQPVPVAGVADAIAVSAGGLHTCALRAARTVTCWGYNGDGQLGSPAAIGPVAPQAIPDLTDVDSISAGEDHTCAVKTDHTVWCWGLNRHGELGQGSTVPSNVDHPVQVLRVLR